MRSFYVRVIFPFTGFFGRPLLGFVPSNNTSCRRANETMMSGVMAGDAANQCALYTPFRVSLRTEGGGQQCDADYCGHLYERSHIPDPLWVLRSSLPNSTR